MDNTTKQVLQSLQDCIEFEGYTQGLSLLVNHKLSSDDRHKVVNEISNLLNDNHIE
jgi:hypothetical protein